MSAHDRSHRETAQSEGSFWTSRAFLICAGFLIVGGIVLWTEHFAHALGVLPYLLILACPLMHVLMHGRHGGHGGHARHRRRHAPGAQPEGEQR